MTRPADISPDATLVAVLGAGKASRFGADKLEQSCAGKPLGRWALDAALASGLQVVWIAGDAVPDFVTAEVVQNPRASEGMGTSVACATRHARRIGAKRLLVMLADMPLVTPALLHQLNAMPSPAACAWNGKPGVPALFASEQFELLEVLTGNRGAAAVLRGLEGVTLLGAPADMMRDVDRPDDLAAVEALLRP